MLMLMLRLMTKVMELSPCYLSVLVAIAALCCMQPTRDTTTSACPISDLGAAHAPPHGVDGDDSDNKRRRRGP